ncbi:hypothetical protein [Lutibacter sp.]|uniref:hypothetical protein n=1 Tax=Lutibacter sp. TaxID=1925666 RepID=UPI00356ADF10
MKTIKKICFAVLFLTITVACTETKKEEVKNETDASVEAVIEKVESVETELDTITVQLDEKAKELDNSLNELDNI